ncbi:hypothetical protein [Marinobacter sp.]|uniref:hypothetical protein n=1 Tax=Marinobacter sp. TaxID=50741 RepID=UPI0038511528
MNDDLKLHLAQRAILLASDDATLAQLRSHDRKLLAAMEQGLLDSPLAGKTLADEDLFRALDKDFAGTLLMLEARARLWPGELLRVQHRLVACTEDSSAAWWLAAHYPSLPCPYVFPERHDAQVWAARALQRRGRTSMLEEPWRSWVSALAGEAALLPVVQALWDLSQGQDWEPWLAPLMVIADQKQSAAVLNWLSIQGDDRLVIQLMGLSCQSRFLPWLANMRRDEALSETVMRELRWLTGGQTSRHEGHQCWGEPLSEESRAGLFQRLPLGFRGRLWHWFGDGVQGAANSLQGGEWCAGS